MVSRGLWFNLDQVYFGYLSPVGVFIDKDDMFRLLQIEQILQLIVLGLSKSE